MNILILSPFIPYPLDQGGKIRVFNLVRHLCRSHRVTLACLSDATMPVLGPLPDLCDEVIIVERKTDFARDFCRSIAHGIPFNCTRYSSEAFKTVLLNLKAKRTFDIVQIEFSMLWQYAALFDGVPVTLDAHNIEYRNVQEIGREAKGPIKRWLYKLEAKKLKTEEAAAWRKCAFCFAVSDNECEEIRQTIGENTKIISAPNGVDPERFTFAPRTRAYKRILLLGGMDYIPNLDATRYFLKEIFPEVRRKEPDAKVLMVGRELSRLGQDVLVSGVECHENVPDVLPWFYEADILAVPLRQGAGTRIKILEAMSAGLPVVSTAKGCEGIKGLSERDLLVANTREEFISSTVRLMKDPELRLKLAMKANQLVMEKYTWAKTAGIIDRCYRRL